MYYTEKIRVMGGECPLGPPQIRPWHLVLYFYAIPTSID